MPSTRTPGETLERWVFSDDELLNPAACSGDDEFVALPEGYEIGIMVQRNGAVTNRWADGTVGVTKDQQDAAAAEETLYNEDRGEQGTMDNYRDVVITRLNGTFLRFASETDKLPIISAETHDDNRQYEVTFDALRWFEQASDEEIIALAECDWGGDYAADAVAEYMEDIDPNVKRMFDNKDCGFECHVNEQDALAWVSNNKPAVFKQIVNA